MNKISVIVPIYNDEEYLEKCIESIIHQTYSNLEIILVDDGSKDNSLKICKRYAKVDDRIVVLHKKNGGLPSARNAGLEVATGDYYMFCDSDDFYLPNSCEILEREITSKKADYVIGNYINCTLEGDLWENPIFDFQKYPDFRLSINDYEKSFYIMSSSVCNKIFRASFIRKLNLRFVDGVPAEDAIFTTYCFIKSKRVYYVSDIIYVYRQRHGGTSISTNNDLSYFKGISKAYYYIYLNFKTNHELGFYRYFYLKTLFYILYKFIDSMVMTEEDKVLSLMELRWFCNLTEELKIQFMEDDFFRMVCFIQKEDYKNAIKVASSIAEVRKGLSEPDKLKMSKIPADEYHKYLKSEVSL